MDSRMGKGVNFGRIHGPSACALDHDLPVRVANIVPRKQGWIQGEEWTRDLPDVQPSQHRLVVGHVGMLVEPVVAHDSGERIHRVLLP